MNKHIASTIADLRGKIIQETRIVHKSGIITQYKYIDISSMITIEINREIQAGKNK